MNFHSSWCAHAHVVSCVNVTQVVNLEKQQVGNLRYVFISQWSFSKQLLSSRVVPCPEYLLAKILYKQSKFCKHG
jgi:hypothetical protein